MTHRCISIPPYVPAERRFLGGICRFFVAPLRVLGDDFVPSEKSTREARTAIALIRDALAAIQDMMLNDTISRHQARKHVRRADSVTFLVHFALQRPGFVGRHEHWRQFFEEACLAIGALEHRMTGSRLEEPRLSETRAFFGDLNAWVLKESLKQLHE